MIIVLLVVNGVWKCGLILGMELRGGVDRMAIDEVEIIDDG